MSRSRTQYLPAPRILSSEDCKRKLFDRLDIEAVESRILAGEYPTTPTP